MSLLKRALHKVLPNPFFQILKKAKKYQAPKFLILWNRGLGDIALGLFSLCEKIKEASPRAEITFLTRKDLSEAFSLLKDINVVVHPTLKRGEKPLLEKLAKECHLKIEEFDFVIEKIDTTRWLSWQLGKVTPRLRWKDEFDALSQKFNLEGKEYIGVHVSSETGQFYGYEKNWPREKFSQLFDKIEENSQRKIILFGTYKDSNFDCRNLIDLRGETSVFEMLSILKNHCSDFIGPDSGVLSLIYYLDVNFPIHVLSLWSDANQGVLKQRVCSPNSRLQHSPFIAPNTCLSELSVEDVFSKIT